MEIMTGNSLFRKTDLLGIEEGAGVCLIAVAFAAAFAWFSSARTKVGGVFSVRCNKFIDSLIDQVVDGMFYETDISDWIDDIWNVKAVFKHVKDKDGEMKGFGCKTPYV